MDTLIKSLERATEMCDFNDVGELLEYIRYLEGIKEDYEQLKTRVQALANYMDSLY